MPQSDSANPLLTLHHQAQAEVQSYGPMEIVSTFGEPQAEYGAIRKACGLLDRPQRGVVELSGRDRLSFLNNLLTNQTWDKQKKAGLAAGDGVYAFILTAKNGRIIVDLNVLELGDRTLLELDRRLVETLLKDLDRYRFSDVVEFRDRSTELHAIALHGPGAVAVLAQAMDSPPPSLDRQLQCSIGRMMAHDIVVFRDDPCGVPGFNLLVPLAHARAIWMNLITRHATSDEPGKRLLRPVGWAAFNTARIEAGRAFFGIDFDENFVPAETGSLLSRAVSFTKGCYPGQEIVARMHARGQVAKQIAGFRMDSDALPIAGAQVLDDQSNVIGAVTSSTISPVLSNAAIGLAILKRPHFEARKLIHIPAEGAIHNAKVVELPFLRG